MRPIIIFLLGALSTTILILILPSDINSITIFERENKPNIARIYKIGIDRLYIEDTKGKYPFTLGKHLRTIPSRAEKEKEEKDIKITAEWYK